MNKYIAIFANDMKNTRRDPTLLVILLVPLLLILITRFGIPPIAEQWPVITDYYNMVIAFFCVLTAMMPGFIVSFMLLDERDQHVLTAMRTMPITPAGFFGMRMLYMFLFGIIGCFLLMQLNGLVEISIIKSLIISLVCAACSPMFVFMTVSLAKNKIEGATIMKVLNVLLMLPIVSLFIDNPLTYLLSIIPFFWIYEGFEVINNTNLFLLYLGIGLAVAIAANYLLYHFALRRYYLK